MDYTNIEQVDNDIILTNVRHFNLAETLDCGQAFRWGKIADETFSGIAHGKRLDVLFNENEHLLTIKNCTTHEFNTTWKNYFDFNRDYSTFRLMFLHDKNLKNAMDFSPGLRLMYQDPWETLVSFILSQNTNIPRIKKMIHALCTCFGSPLPCGGFTFPSPEKIATLTVDDLSPIRCGYRAKYIIDAAQQTACGKFDITYLKTRPTDEVKQALLNILGVGPKVADCVLLYGFGRVECYPIDVWIKRVMTALYPQGFPEELNNHAGIAQLFLFHYVRNGGQRQNR